MKEKLVQLADALNAATGGDTPRHTMNAVANQLRALAAGVPDDGGARSLALQLASQIEGHQYGLRGFGDGSLSRGRDLSQQERATIMLALHAFGTSSAVKLPSPAYYHAPGDGQIWRTSPLYGMPEGMEGLYSVEQVRALLP